MATQLQHRCVPLVFVSLGLLVLPIPAALSADPPILSSPGSSNGQVYFTLTGLPGVIYVIEASIDLQTWASVSTNNASTTTRVIILTNCPSGQSFYRARRRLFPPRKFAIAATGPISFSGPSVVDSFDSRIGPYEATNRNANGNILTDSQQTNAIDIGNANIYGLAITGPGGSIVLSGGAIGDVDWNSTHTGIEPGWADNTANLGFIASAPPAGPFSTPVRTQSGSSNITYLSDGSYQTGVFVSSDSYRPMIVTGHALLWVIGDIFVSGNGYIYIQPGASLVLYVGGKAVFAGGGIVNGSGLARNLSYIGLSSNTQLTYSAGAPFVGTVNAPQATFSLTTNLYGSCIINSFSVSGGASVHYDESLDPL